MYPLAHLGLGYALVQASPQIRRFRLPPFWIFLGTLLPDLVDKPLYYFCRWWTGRSGMAIGLISGTRTIGHTLLFAVGLLLVSLGLRSKNIVAVFLGCLTHIVLDEASDLALSKGALNNVGYFFWPFAQSRFPEIPYHDLSAQLLFSQRWVPLSGELAGALILAILFVRQKASRQLPRASGRLGSKPNLD